MGFQGLDFGSGLSNLSNVLEQGYKDRAALQKEQDMNSRAYQLKQMELAQQQSENELNRQNKIDVKQIGANALGKAAANRPDLAQKALQFTLPLLESARGSPDIAQAKKDLYSAAKVDSLAKLYSDPNNLSQSQVNLLAQEVGKIAAGGVSTAHELEGITPDTLTGKMSMITSKFTNQPTAANAAAFVKQFQDYTGALKKDAQKVIQDKYGRVIDANKNALGDANYQNLQNLYIKPLLSPSMPAQQTQAPQFNVQAFTQNALKAGASQDQIDAYIKNKIGSPQPISAPGRMPQSIPQQAPQPQYQVPPNQSFQNQQMSPSDMSNFLDSGDEESGQ